MGMPWPSSVWTIVVCREVWGREMVNHSCLNIQTATCASVTTEPKSASQILGGGVCTIDIRYITPWTPPMRCHSESLMTSCDTRAVHHGWSLRFWHLIHSM
ncbi:hypothetical protein C8R48DRAFT_732201 [Suillus tomentosus]|nr:hypothetical protein C8R48DRAFT_732201 [Suillus tomentosus]